MENGSVGLDAAQTNAAKAAAPKEDRERGTVTNNPTFVAVARLDKIVSELPDLAQQKRVVGILVEEWQAKGLI